MTPRLVQDYHLHGTDDGRRCRGCAQQEGERHLRGCPATSMPPPPPPLFERAIATGLQWTSHDGLSRDEEACVFGSDRDWYVSVRVGSADELNDGTLLIYTAEHDTGPGHIALEWTIGAPPETAWARLVAALTASGWPCPWPGDSP